MPARPSMSIPRPFNVDARAKVVCPGATRKFDDGRHWRGGAYKYIAVIATQSNIAHKLFSYVRHL